MENFCNQCGKPLGRDGKCLNCGNMNTIPIKSRKKPIDPERAKFIPRKNGKKSKSVIWLLVVLSILTVGTLTLSTLVYLNIINIPYIDEVFLFSGVKNEAVKKPESKNETEATPQQPTQPVEGEVTDANSNNAAQYKVTPPDADQYFEDNSSVVSETGAGDSQTISSEAEVYDNLEGRGFNNVTVTTSYSDNGEYIGETIVSRYSGTVHPIYQAYYTTSSGNIWLILEINGKVMTIPVSYNEQSTRTAPLVISETNTIISYDSTLHKFYENTPNSDVVIIKKVDIINAETLDNLTNGELDKL